MSVVVYQSIIFFCAICFWILNSVTKRNCLYQKYDKMKETRKKRSLLLFALKRETNSFCIGYGVQCKICTGMLFVM